MVVCCGPERRATLATRRTIGYPVSVLLLALAAGMAGCAGDDTPVTSATEATRFTWRELPPLPRAIAGQMAGNSHGALLVAGGTDFPAPPTEGGAKVWYDTVHVLEPGASSWTSTTPLPHPLAYAAAATTADRVVLAGGSDATQHYADVRSHDVGHPGALSRIEGMLED